MEERAAEEGTNFRRTGSDTSGVLISESIANI